MVSAFETNESRNQLLKDRAQFLNGHGLASSSFYGPVMSLLDKADNQAHLAFQKDGPEAGLQAGLTCIEETVQKSPMRGYTAMAQNLYKEYMQEVDPLSRTEAFQKQEPPVQKPEPVIAQERMKSQAPAITPSIGPEPVANSPSPSAAIAQDDAVWGNYGEPEITLPAQQPSAPSASQDGKLAQAAQEISTPAHSPSSKSLGGNFSEFLGNTLPPPSNFQRELHAKPSPPMAATKEIEAAIARNNNDDTIGPSRPSTLDSPSAHPQQHLGL
jgi:hypothetical protein